MGERMSAAEIGNELLREGCGYDLVARVRGELNARDAEIADLRAKLAALVEAAEKAVDSHCYRGDVSLGIVEPDWTVEEIREGESAIGALEDAIEAAREKGGE